MESNHVGKKKLEMERENRKVMNDVKDNYPARMNFMLVSMFVSSTLVISKPNLVIISKSMIDLLNEFFVDFFDISFHMLIYIKKLFVYGLLGFFFFTSFQ